MNTKYTHVKHTIEPVYDKNSRVLILGSLPSVKSREVNFFYGNPQNRFWKVLPILFNDECPNNIGGRREYLIKHHIAVWDTIYECDIIGSADSSIKNVIPTDLKRILDTSNIKHIYCNGKASARYFEKYQEKELGIKAVTLPSTSPANAAWNIDKLCAAWDVILNDLEK